MTSRRILLTLTALAVLLSAFAMFPSTAGAVDTQYTVTTTADHADGSCAADCSLRDAVIAANANVGTDSIVIPPGTYSLTLTGTDNASSVGDLDILGPVSIFGAGVGVTKIDGFDSDRVFHIGSSAGSVSLLDLTIQNGRVSNLGGAGIWNEGSFTLLGYLEVTDNHDDGGTSAAIGGGIRNNGALSLQYSTVKDNSATRGGGIFNTGGATLSIVNSTIAWNTSPGVSGLQGYGDTTATNTTISENISTGGGSAVTQESASSLALYNTTIFHNTGRGLAPNTATTLRNTILDDNTLSDCIGAVTVSLGGNTASDMTCVLPHGTDDNGIDPGLGLLGEHGGPTQTNALNPGSSSINSGVAACTVADQRGAPRAGACDRGAYDFVTCGGQPVNMVGSDLDDILQGSGKPNVAIGLGGDDTLRGLGGSDRLCGGIGNDKAIGGSGNDHLYGEAGTDRCVGGTGSDTASACEIKRSIP